MASLGGVAVNGARAVGPALAGVLVAQVGPAAVFAVNAAAATGLRGGAAGLAPAAHGHRAAPGAVRQRDAGRRALRAQLARRCAGCCCGCSCSCCPARRSGRCCRWWPTTCWTPARPVTGCCSARWVPAPSSAPRCCPGWAPGCRPTGCCSGPGVLFAGSLVACVFVPNLIVLAVLLVPAGMAWLTVLMGVTGALQVFLPGWVRARGLSMFNVVFAGSQAVGSLLWGLIAQGFGLVADVRRGGRGDGGRRGDGADLAAARRRRLGPRPGRLLAGARAGLRARPAGGPDPGDRALRGAGGERGGVPRGDGAGAGAATCAPGRPAARSTATGPTRRRSCWSGCTRPGRSTCASTPAG